MCMYVFSVVDFCMFYVFPSVVGIILFDTRIVPLGEPFRVGNSSPHFNLES